MNNDHYSDQSGSFKIKKIFVDNPHGTEPMLISRQNEPTLIIPSILMRKEETTAPVAEPVSFDANATADAIPLQQDFDVTQRAIDLSALPVPELLPEPDAVIEIIPDALPEVETEKSHGADILPFPLPAPQIESALQKGIYLIAYSALFVAFWLFMLLELQQHFVHARELREAQAVAVANDPSAAPGLTGLDVPAVSYDQLPNTAVLQGETVYLPPLPSPSAFHAFLDVRTDPVPAKIYLGDKLLGVAPFRKNVALELQDSYELSAVYVLPDVKDTLTVKGSFVADPDRNVVLTTLPAPIGIINMQSLPESAIVTISGTYQNDGRTVAVESIPNIIPGKPLYLPHGQYTIQVARPGATAQDAAVPVFLHTQELNHDHPLVNLTLKDADLTSFALRVSSEPAGAAVLFDNQIIGYTPLAARQNLGAHEVKISLNGYLDEMFTADVSVSSLLEKQITLLPRTTANLVKRAQENAAAGKIDQAEPLLNEALTLAVDDAEKSSVNLELGRLFLAKGDFATAKTHFDAAQGVDAKLGWVEAEAALSQPKTALAALLNVMTQFATDTPEELRLKANGLFQKLSPDHGMLFFKTTPESASVIVNDVRIFQKSPFLLGELKEGEYQVTLKKDGFPLVERKEIVKPGEFRVIEVAFAPPVISGESVPAPGASPTPAPVSP